MSEEQGPSDAGELDRFEDTIIPWMARTLPGFLAHEFLREADRRTETAVHLKEIDEEGRLVIAKVVERPSLPQAVSWLLTSARRGAECSFFEAAFSEVLEHYTTRTLSCALEVVLTLRQRGVELPDTPDIGRLAPDAGLVLLLDMLWSATPNTSLLRAPTRYRLLRSSEKLEHVESKKRFSIRDQCARYLVLLESRGGLPVIDAVSKADSSAPSRPSASRKYLLEVLENALGTAAAGEFFDASPGGGFSLGVDLEIVDL